LGAVYQQARVCELQAALETDDGEHGAARTLLREACRTYTRLGLTADARRAETAPQDRPQQVLPGP
jgi:hypothetical protein